MSGLPPQTLGRLRVVVPPDGEEEVEAELDDLEDHDDGDAQVEAERSAEAGEKSISLLNGN